jgi:hypothetical protein
VPARYSRLRKPPYQPPAAASPVVWTALFGDIAATSAVTIDRVLELSSVDDAHLSKGARPDAYPAPIVDRGAERTEALRRFQGI